MATQDTYHAALGTTSMIYINTPRQSLLTYLVGLSQYAQTRLYVQHPDQIVATNLGLAFAPGAAPGDLSRAHVLQLSRLYNDVKQVAAGLDAIDEVVDISILNTVTGPGNGNATTSVSEIDVHFTWTERSGYILTVTVPHNEARYGNLYKLGMWFASEPAGTIGCATCGHPHPKFQCDACEVDMYCGKACQKEAWEGGHDKACARS